jgi:membrane associated rhomboid family serine protease
VFWGIVAANFLGVVLAKEAVEGGNGAGGEASPATATLSPPRDAILDHFRASLSALRDGRWHTLLTSPLIHLSAVHCALNVLPLALCRRAVPLSGVELAAVYGSGCVAGAISHVAWMWHETKDAPDERYALNTPAFVGSSGGTAAVLACQAALAPAALAALAGAIPFPVVGAAFLFACVGVKEALYSDGPPAKVGGVLVGALAAVAIKRARVVVR